jgi:uncharacterized membrane protein YkvA (DUF1232 family)
MPRWLVGLGVALGCLVLSWALLLVLARRLPPGILRDLAAFIPDCVTTVRRLRRDPRVPRRARVAIVVAGKGVASPIDQIPDLIPVLGPLDENVVVALALRYAGRQVPREVLLAAWPGEPRLLERLLGPATASADGDGVPPGQEGGWDDGGNGTMTDRTQRDAGETRDAGSSTDQHITGTEETGTFLTDQAPTAGTPSHGSSNAGINAVDGNRPDRAEDDTDDR